MDLSERAWKITRRAHMGDWRWTDNADEARAASNAGHVVVEYVRADHPDEPADAPDVSGAERLLREIRDGKHSIPGVLVQIDRYFAQRLRDV